MIELSVVTVGIAIVSILICLGVTISALVGWKRALADLTESLDLLTRSHDREEELIRLLDMPVEDDK